MMLAFFKHNSTCSGRTEWNLSESWLCVVHHKGSCIVSWLKMQTNPLSCLSWKCWKEMTYSHEWFRKVVLLFAEGIMSCDRKAAVVTRGSEVRKKCRFFLDLGVPEIVCWNNLLIVKLYSLFSSFVVVVVLFFFFSLFYLHEKYFCMILSILNAFFIFKNYEQVWCWRYLFTKELCLNWESKEVIVV